MKERSFIQYLSITLKGLGMGAADIVPGVSGGTIAFISGIYQELLEAIASVNVVNLKILFKGNFKTFWKSINGNFLIALFSGIFISILSLAKLISYLLAHQPVFIWSFFFGLILASTVVIGRKVSAKNISNILFFIAGTAIAYFITVASPTHGPDGLIYIFGAGFIAICAMILPGISGSFILLLLGYYSTILGNVTEMIEALKAKEFGMVLQNILLLSVFVAGCIAGILSFSKLLTWLFKKAEQITLALLTGFMLGSINKVWPWKKVIAYRTNSKGEEVPFLEENVMPSVYETVTGMEAHTAAAISLMIGGFILVYYIERLGEKK
jgi:putative membrane protein